MQVVYNFGREDAANREALQRLVASVTRFLDPGAALAASAEGLEFTESRPLGGTWVLDALWARLGHRAGDAPPAQGPPAGRDARSGCCSPWSRTGRWPRRRSWPPPAGSNEDVLVDGPAGDQRRRLLPGDGLADGDHAATWSGRSSTGLVDLLNLEVDVLFFDTTSTYFVTEDEDEPGRPRRARHAAGRRERRQRRGRGPGAAAGSGPGASPRTTATTCPRS